MFREIPSTKKCSLSNGSSKRTKLKRELESTISPFSRLSTKRALACKGPIRIWKHCETNCPTGKSKQSSGGEL